MADAKGVANELRAFNEKLLRVAVLEVQAEMKRMTPVGNTDNWGGGRSSGNKYASQVKGAPSQANGYVGGTLRAAVQVDFDDLPHSATVFNNLPYAQRVYLEGHSRQLPQGEFQAFVSRIPSRMEQIGRALR